ncbi:hypothetical protein [Kamptonema formosum]|uniref:hypothetical protein n=1 Tax=Kamptonema formosum TaxID=331992 RepID=UPI00034B10B6|nr:hypothetical protein [Oscillatoria sp. PCC 10802]
MVKIDGRPGCSIAQICARTQKIGDSRNSHRRAIYQSALYECSKQLSLIARILAEVFKCLNEGTVPEIEAATPADEGTPVGVLIEGFDL